MFFCGISDNNENGFNLDRLKPFIFITKRNSGNKRLHFKAFSSTANGA